MTFRPLERRDLAQLAVWLAAPHVAVWWREDASPEAVAARYGPTIDGDDATEVFVAQVDGVDAALAQRYLLRDQSEWAASLAPALPPGLTTEQVAGIDYLIGPADLIGRGIGPQIIAAFTDDTLARYPEVEMVAVAVLEANRRSWRALQKAGYRRTFVGPLDSQDPADQGTNVVSVYRRPRSGPVGASRRRP